MKKIICIMVGSILTINTCNAITLCKKSGTAVAVLNKIVNGVVDASTANNRWQINMSDGNVVKGKSLCNGMPGEYAVVNTGVADVTDAGFNCYCKMMTPATSYWVNASGSNSYATESECEANCVIMCAEYMAIDQVFRSAVYEAIW